MDRDLFVGLGLRGIGGNYEFLLARRERREGKQNYRRDAGFRRNIFNGSDAAFIGGLVQGSLFPTFGDSGLRWIALRFSVEDWAKLLVWSFIAGFSERLVPEILNNLSARVRTSEAGFAEAAEPKGNAIKRVVVD